MQLVSLHSLSAVQAAPRLLVTVLELSIVFDLQAPAPTNTRAMAEQMRFR